MAATYAQSRDAEWVTRMCERSVLDVADALGINTDNLRGSNPQRRGLPCFLCSDEHRHTQSKTRDMRGPVGPRPDGHGWRCFQCDASGNAIGYVAAARHGKLYKDLKSDASATADVREWCMRFLGISAPARSSSSARSRPRPLPRPARPAPAPRPEPAPNYPPPEEVDALWRVCVPVTDAPKVAAWLQSKRLDAQAIADRDLARALPPGASTPDWARSWAQRGYQLIVQQVDARGHVRSVKARNVIGAEPKSLPPKDFDKRGLVMACPLGRKVLASGRRPEWWPADRPLLVDVCEGEKKQLGRVLDAADSDELAPIVFGVESGSWTAELGARIPDGSSVFVATDPNDAGAQYATKIVRSLAPRLLARTVQVELRPRLELVVEGTNVNDIFVRVKKVKPA